MIAKVLLIAIYFLFGYWMFQKGVEAYGGKEEYMKIVESDTRYYLALFLVITFWPLLIIRGLIRR